MRLESLQIRLVDNINISTWYIGLAVAEMIENDWRFAVADFQVYRVRIIASE